MLSVKKCRPGKDGFFNKTSQLYHICLARCPSPKIPFVGTLVIILNLLYINVHSFSDKWWWTSNRADVERVQMKDIIAFTLLVILPLVLFISTFWWY